MKKMSPLPLLLYCLLPAISNADDASGTAAGPEPPLELSEPVTVAMAPPEVKGWGPYQFPGLERLPDGRILKNGVTLAVYGRPGLYVRATADPAGLRWAQRVTVVPPGAIGTETCSYAGLLPLSDDRALLAYSDFNLHNAEGQRCKGIRVREVKARSPNEVLAEAPPRKGHWRRGQVIQNPNRDGHHTEAGYVR